MNIHAKPAAALAPSGKPRASGRDRSETHSARLERLAAEAEGQETGEDLGKLSAEERRKRLFA